MPVLVIAADTYRVREEFSRTARLCLFTDAPEGATLPAELLAACDEIRAGIGDAAARAAEREEASVVWQHGERWIEGNAARLRYAFTTPRHRYFVPLHFPGGALPDLIGIVPRWYTPGTPRTDGFDPRFRIAAATEAAADGLVALDHGSDHGGEEPWQQLLGLLRLEQRQPGAAVAPLAQMCRWQANHPLLHTLLLRNLAVALLRAGDSAPAATVLRHARALFPQCREFDYLAAVVCLARGEGGEAVRCLRVATSPATGVYAGSGGESGYRAHALLAGMAEATGQQRVAVHHFLSGVRHAPAFEPAVAGILRQRMPLEMLDGVQWELSRLARREPRYVAPVFDFFLLHQAWPAATRMLETLPLEPARREAMRNTLEALAPLYRPGPRLHGQKVGITVSGPLLNHSSLARVNRYLAAALAQDARFEVAISPTHCGLEPAIAFPGGAALAGSLRRLPRRLDLTIRQNWPPRLEAPATGGLAAIVPWEFRGVPRAWIEGLNACAEVWTPSQFARQAFVEAGVEPERVVVIPSGFDPELYMPAGPAHVPGGVGRFRFLFVGGAIPRKGMDLLLRAWRAAFSAADDVSLLIKEMGSNGFYRHQQMGREIAALAADTHAAPVLVDAEEWSEARMPMLYRGCDALVIPYRGEGFCLPLLEALACGKPVITTGAGPAPEFCPPAAGWLLPAATVEVPRAMWPPEELTSPLRWFEPDFDALVEALRAAAGDPAGAARRGGAGAAAVRPAYTWEAVTAQYRERIAALVE